MLKYSVFILFLIVTAINTTKVNNCNGKPLPRAVRIEGCETAPCAVYKGKTALAEIDFTLPKSSKSLQTKVYANAFGITVPYELPGDLKDTCKHLLNGSYCPLDSGEDVTHQFSLPVDKIYPTITVGIEVSSINEKDEVVFCFTSEIQVKS